MHAEKKVLIVLTVMAFMMLAAVNAAAVVMTVGSGTDAADQTIQIPITVDDPTGIAGAAFTLEYDTSLLSITVDSTFFDTFANQFVGTPAEGTNSVTVDGQTYTQPLITNSISTGLRIAAARAAAETDSANTTLFTLNVDFIGDIATTTMPIPITVASTTLSNTDAGYDAGGETIPILVGADPSVSDLTDPAAFPIKLDPANSIGSTVNGGVTLTLNTISGSIAYSGEQIGRLYVSAGGGSVENPFNTDPTAYTLSIASGTYTVSAFIDTDGSGAKDDWEPQGASASVTIPPNATGIDFSLSEDLTHDSDGDEMPSWWEAKYGLDPGDPGDKNADPDNDSYTNIEEYQNGTNPNFWDDIIKPRQIVTIEPSVKNVLPGSDFIVDVKYDVSDNDNTLSGLDISIHFDSSKISYNGFENFLDQGDLKFQPTLYDDTTNDEDNDPTTDKRINMSWASFSGNWPNTTLAELLTKLKFSWIDMNAQDGDCTPINVSVFDHASSHDFVGNDASACAILFNMDVDGNGECKPLTDGLLIIRYLFRYHLAGPSWIDGIVASDGTRKTAAEIEEYLENAVNNGALDIDGNGETKPLTDGLLVIRYLFRYYLAGDTWIEGIVASDCTTCLPLDIKTYLDSIMCQ